MKACGKGAGGVPGKKASVPGFKKGGAAKGMGSAGKGKAKGMMPKMSSGKQSSSGW